MFQYRYYSGSEQTKGLALCVRSKWAPYYAITEKL